MMCIFIDLINFIYFIVILVILVFFFLLFINLLNLDKQNIHRLPKRRAWEKPIFSESPPIPPGGPNDPKNRRKTRRQLKRERDRYEEELADYERRKAKFYEDLEKYPFYNDPEGDSKILFYFCEYKYAFLLLTFMLIITGNFGDW